MTDADETLREALTALVRTDTRWMRDQFDNPSGGVTLHEAVTVKQILDLLAASPPPAPALDEAFDGTPTEMFGIGPEGDERHQRTMDQIEEAERG